MSDDMPPFCHEHWNKLPSHLRRDLWAALDTPAASTHERAALEWISNYSEDDAAQSCNGCGARVGKGHKLDCPNGPGIFL